MIVVRNMRNKEESEGMEERSHSKDERFAEQLRIYWASQSQDLSSKFDKLRKLIGEKYWGAVGDYREFLVRSALRAKNQRIMSIRRRRLFIHGAQTVFASRCWSS